MPTPSPGADQPREPSAGEARDTNRGVATSEGAPPDWDVNPSIWRQRLPIVGAAVLGFGIAIYMGLYQLRLVSGVWDPIFGDSTEKVLDSKVSEAFPVPDALLGAFGYLADAVAGIIGGTLRWRTMPWIVVLFGVFVGPLGLVSIALIMAQPLVVGHWCAPCLATALISVLMIGPAMDEMLASLQYLKGVWRREGRRASWARFWGREPRRSA